MNPGVASSWSSSLLSELDNGQINFLKKHSPSVVFIQIDQILHHSGKGAVHMNNREIKGSFNNSSLNGNFNIQSDNNNNEFNGNIDSEKIELAFSDLLENIQKIPDEDERDQAETNLESLRQALDNHDSEKTSKLLRLLGKTLGNVASLATIASALGIPSPF